MIDYSASIAIIGAGAVGRAMTQAAINAGRPVIALATRTPERCDWIAQSDVLITTDLDTATKDADVIVLCVPDDLVTSIASSLRNTAGKLLVHTAGSLDLTPVSIPTAHPGSLHPVMVLMHGGRGCEALRGAAAAIDGDDVSRPWLHRFASDIGMEPMEIASDKRSLHHLAASLAGGLLTGVLADAVSLWHEAGIPESMAATALGRMVEEIGRTIAGGSGPGPVMGPAARGDIGTLTRHLDELNRHSPQLQGIYRELVERCAAWSVERGIMDGQTAQDIQTLMHQRSSCDSC